MIHSDKEMEATQERIEEFQRILAQLRVTARRAEYPLVAGGYKAEIIKMQNEILEYLMRHASESARVEVA